VPSFVVIVLMVCLPLVEWATAAALVLSVAANAAMGTLPAAARLMPVIKNVRRDLSTSYVSASLMDLSVIARRALSSYLRM